MITSSSPAEGKTTTPANLAFTFAQHCLRVPPVDSDLRRPQRHTVSGVPKEPRLTQFVLGHAAADEFVHRTPVEGLFVLSSGTLPPNPSELLGGERMQEVLNLPAESFALIILRYAAAGSGGRRDPGVPEQWRVVVRAGKTERAAAQQAQQQLATVGARVVGAVLKTPTRR